MGWIGRTGRTGKNKVGVLAIQRFLPVPPFLPFVFVPAVGVPEGAG